MEKGLYRSLGMLGLGEERRHRSGENEDDRGGASGEESASKCEGYLELAK